MIKKSNIDRIVESLKKPDKILETKDKVGTSAHCYVLIRQGEKPLLSIVRGGYNNSIRTKWIIIEKVTERR